MGSSVSKYFDDMSKNKELYTFTINTPLIHESPDNGKTVTSRPMNIPPKKDKYVQSVKEKFEERSQTGIKKYNTTLEREDLNLLDWLTHLQEELMDATLYVEKLKDFAKNNTSNS
tara:strand:+ start:65 stop:409 length:345 start_codon:yes stop_codon:yes gene_type:complete